MDETQETCPPAMRKVLRQVAGGCVQRARRVGRSYEPRLFDLALERYRSQNGRCALSGIEFDLREVGQGAAKRPFAPSLDRVDATGGYTADNVRLVCQAVNFVLNAYGELEWRGRVCYELRFFWW